MYYVYALLSMKNQDLYIGYSEDLRKRFQEHNSGRVKATKANRPWNLVYYESFRTKLDATAREKQLKSHRAKSDLKIQIKHSIIGL
jgi:putative endonuclease